MTVLFNSTVATRAVAQVLLADGTQGLAPVVLQVDSGGNIVTPGGSGTGASAGQVQGNAASGATEVGNPVGIGGYASASAPTAVTAGQRVRAWYDLSGAAVIAPKTTSAALNDSLSNTVILPLDSNGASYAARGLNYKYNGNNSWDRDRKPNVFSRLTASAATGSPTLVKSSAGDLSTFWGQNGAAITYLQIYNKGSAPVLGTDTPVLTFPIPANATFSAPAGVAGAYLSAGIAYAFTTDVAGTTAAAANAVTGFALLAA